jgi:hypothetical protein
LCTKYFEGLFSEELRVNVKNIQLEEHKDDTYLNKKPIKAIQGLLMKNGYKVLATIPHGFGNFREIIFKKGIE